MFLPKAQAWKRSLYVMQSSSLFTCAVKRTSKTIRTDVFVFARAGITITIVQCLV